MQPHSSQTEHQLCSVSACLLFHINITVTNLQPSTSQSALCTDMWHSNWNGTNLYMFIQPNIPEPPWSPWCLFNKAHFLSMDNQLTHSFCSHKKVRSTQILTLQHWQVPVTLDDKQQYLIVHAILMTLKQMVGEEELVNITGNSVN